MTERIPEFDLEQLKQAWEEAQRQHDFWAEHFQEFVGQKKYRDKFLALKDGEVVGVGRDLVKLIERLREKGLDPKDVWIRFITRDIHKLTGH